MHRLLHYGLRSIAVVHVVAFMLFTTLMTSIAVAQAQPQRPAVRPQVIAHRGASGYLPEHTLAAKAFAYGMGADFIEQDVVLSKDGVAVVLHDIHLDTVTDVAARFPERRRDNGRYFAIDFTLAELRQLRVSERINEKTGKQAHPQRFPHGQSTFAINTLEEELQLIQGLNKSTGRRVGVYPEIKQAAFHRREGHDISAIVIGMLTRYGYTSKEDSCIVQSFEWEEVKRIRGELKWNGRLILLMGGGKADVARQTPEALADLAKVVDGIGPPLDSIVEADGRPTRLVTDAHAARLVVHPYTLRNDGLPKWARTPDDALEALYGKAAVDALFTDFPDTAVNWLNRRSAPVAR